MAPHSDQSPHDAFGLPADDSPVNLDPKNVALATGAAVAGIAIPPNDQGYPPGPAILISYRFLCPHHRVEELAQVVFVPFPDGPDLHDFARVVTTAAEIASDPANVASGQANALDAMAAQEAARDPQLAPRCPGCGSRLFGDVADRGACYACFPKAPDDETLDAAAPIG